MKKIFFVLLLSFNVFAMEEVQTFRLLDESIVTINPYPIMEKLKRLSEQDLLKVWNLCLPNQSLNFIIYLTDNFKSRFPESVKIAKDFGLITNDIISPDMRKIIVNAITIERKCCRDRVVVIDPTYKYDLEYQDDCVIL